MLELRLDVVIIVASSAALCLARCYALAIRNAADGALRPFRDVASMYTDARNTLIVLN